MTGLSKTPPTPPPGRPASPVPPRQPSPAGPRPQPTHPRPTAPPKVADRCPAWLNEFGAQLFIAAIDLAHRHARASAR